MRRIAPTASTPMSLPMPPDLASPAIAEYHALRRAPGERGHFHFALTCRDRLFVAQAEKVYNHLRRGADPARQSMADTPSAIQSWLLAFLSNAGGVAGTVHFCRDGGLSIAAAVNVPPKVMEAVTWVPSGKGMAGLALERGESIRTCNLQEDRSGAVKPGAKAVDAKGAAAIPVKTDDGGVRAVVGIAFADERQFSESDLDALTEAVKTLPDA